MKADGLGNLYVLGVTQSVDFPATLTVGSRSRPNQVPGDLFVAKIRIEGWTLFWSVIVKPATPLGLAVGSDGGAFVTGYTDDATLFPASAGAFRSARWEAARSRPL